MSTTVRVTSDPAEFKVAVFPFLQRDPVLNTAILGNTEDRVRGVIHDPDPPVFVSIHQLGGLVVGAAICTAQRGVNLGGLRDALVPAAVDAFAEFAPGAKAIEGTTTAARLFTEQFSARVGRDFRVTRGSRLHKLRRFAEQKADGAPRQATSADGPLATEWMGAYGVDIERPMGQAEEERWVRARIELGRLWLWENDDRVVSMVGHQHAVFGATRVGPVYTPPAERGHGYASALTADVTRRILATGSAACLFTDLANPTSNKIYAAIGYEPVTDFLTFESP